MRTALAGLILSLSACNFAPTYLPDGGRARVTCDATTSKIPVTVLDAAGKPAVGATVTAVNAQTAETKTGKTDARGVFELSDELAPGAVSLTAALGTQSSSDQNTTWICGECGCAGSPRAITLTLR